ncbi:MAG: nucleoside 2-deoxyribosyltransferase domain-containing protein [Candidimonas sp.]
MIEIKSPHTYSTKKPILFLAGSIEMGSAKPWQSQFTERLSHLDITVLNPRRDDWDSTWKQSIDNSKFKQQVEWELSGQEISDIIFVYLQAETKSPITLLEIGLFGGSNMIVYCEDGYWRKGNVDIVCHRYGICQVDSFETAVSEIEDRITGIEK